jgi:hypothetical protein
MKRGINLSYSKNDSPSTGVLWMNMTKKERIKLLQESIYLFSPEIDISVIDAHDNGQVSIVIKSVIGINDRGSFLLNLEENLKRTIDIGINVWHEAIGDKSSLRNLRGIEVLS